MTQYNIYLSGTKYPIEANPKDTLRSLREKLGNKADNYDFVYYNDFTDKKTILNDRNVEIKQTIDKIVFPDHTVIMTVVQGQKTDLFGMKTNWLYNRHTGVQIVLNQSDNAARQQNADKFQPIMLTDVQPSNQNSNAFYDRAVICEKSSIIQFNISSWGAVGFGYSITSEKDSICDNLYITYGNNPNRQSNSSLLRYQRSNNSIQIESTETLHIPTSDIITYQKITVKTWRLTSYEQNGKTFTSNTQPPQIIASPMIARTFALTGMQLFSPLETKGVFDPGSPGGDTFVPGQDIQSGAPGLGPESQQQFGSFSLISEDDRNSTVLGSVVFYFFVFRDKEAANRVINVLNAPSSSAIG
jgi:hypothetical protein